MEAAVAAVPTAGHGVRLRRVTGCRPAPAGAPGAGTRVVSVSRPPAPVNPCPQDVRRARTVSVRPEGG
jgi:hypothetical protein